MKYLIGYQTAKGPVFIAQAPDGKYCSIWNGRVLECLDSIAATLDNVAYGHCPSPSDNTDLRSLDISPDIGFWVPADSLR